MKIGDQRPRTIKRQMYLLKQFSKKCTNFIPNYSFDFLDLVFRGHHVYPKRKKNLVKRFYLKEVEVNTYFEDFYESVYRCTCIASKNKRIIDKVYAIRSKIKKTTTCYAELGL
jgi:hypothetical protein